MLLATLLTIAALAGRIDSDAGLASVRATLSALAPTRAEAAPRYEPDTRAVTNWRAEAGEALRPTALAFVVRWSHRDPAFVARCVKLNNYWCIKRAGWTGEVGADGEGHTGFATAADGANAAATLLRRYYREFHRRSALAIVRRWAPAECGSGSAGTGGSAPAGPVSRSVAPGGIGRTLRARFLARHLRGGAPRRHLARGPALRVQPWSALARTRQGATQSTRAPLPPLRSVPSIVAGIGSVEGRNGMPASPPVPERRLRGADDPEALLRGRPETQSPARDRLVQETLGQERLVAEARALPSIAGGPAALRLDLAPPAPFCSGDEARIRNYATRIAGSLGLKPDDDLKLFAPDGTALPALGAVMLAMSAVELGTLRATPDLVAGAVARLAERPTTAPSAEAKP